MAIDKTQGKFYNADNITNVNYAQSYEGAAVFGGKVKYAGAQDGDQKFIVDAVDIDWNGYKLKNSTKNQQPLENVTSTGRVIEEISYLQSGISDLSTQLRLITAGSSELGYLGTIAQEITNIWNELSANTNTNTDFASLLDYLRQADNTGDSDGQLVAVTVTPDAHGLGVADVTVDESVLSGRLSSLDSQLSSIDDRVEAIENAQIVTYVGFEYEANQVDNNEPGALHITIQYL